MEAIIKGQSFDVKDGILNYHGQQLVIDQGMDEQLYITAKTSEGVFETLSLDAISEAQFTYSKYGHGKYQVLDPDGYDIIGEYVSLKDAKNTVAIANLKVELQSMPIVPLLVANMLASHELSVEKVEETIYDLLFYADAGQLRSMIKNREFLKECISATIYQ